MQRAITVAIALLFACKVLPAQTTVTGGLENLALGAQTDASSSASAADGKYPPPMAIDGNSNTHWATAANAQPPQWFELTFAAPITIDTIVLEQSDLTEIYSNAERIELSFSEGAPIEVVLEDRPDGQVIHFEPRTTGSMRVTFLSAHEQKVYFGIDELSLFNDPNQMVRAIMPPRRRWENPDLTDHGRVHPCVNKTPADVERARENAERYPFLADFVENNREQADEWLERGDEWILEMLPEGGAAFAYGFTGCPICDAKWGTWGGARCSWDLPEKVTCANGHVLPDEDHPDPGTGYVGEDGRIHYFVGSWNAWVVETLQFNALRPLCLTYLLTGDERYAEKAAFILDALAQIYPECDAGSWDYPSSPPSGRFCRPWYQVARVLIHYADFYDEVFNSPALDKPSLVEGMTCRQNIEENLLRNGAAYCYEESLKGGLHNGEADYLRGAMSVGCVLGIDHYVDWALDGPYGIRSMVANNADRDGRYYETSLSYALHARDLYLTFSEPMRNYRSESYPEGIDLYADPKFLSFFFLPSALFDCAGHWPRYGDSGPDTAFGLRRDPVFSATDYEFAEVCYARTTGDLRSHFADALTYLTGERGEELRASARDRMWMLFHAGDFPEMSDPEATRERILSSDFFGQKGIAILRAGDDDQAQAALVRYGPSLNHGHFDDLNLNYYALGCEVTYDLGYGLGSTHTQVGWGKQTASHNLVVVDEQRQNIGIGGSGGDLLLLADQPGLQVLEAEAQAAYATQGVDRYQRLVALLGEGADHYLVDIFRVSGGSQHDYMLHALSTQLSVEGVELGEIEPGSLAGPEFEWGRLQGNDGDMKGHPNQPYWTPPPGNGYGFLVDVRRGEAPSRWDATWQIDPARDARLRAIGLPEAGTQLITAWAPGIYPTNPKAAYICARRGGDDLDSTYVTVLEPTQRPVDRNSVRAQQILNDATFTGGSAKSVLDGSVVLYQAEAAGERMLFSAELPETDDYIVTVRHYLSPGYGSARLLVDGEPLGEVFSGTAMDVGPAPARELGTLRLEAGRHELALEAVAPSADGGNYWMGLVSVGFMPEGEAQEAGPIEPRIATAERIEANREGGVQVRIAGRDGVEDRLFSAVDNAPRVYDDGSAVTGRLARVRSDQRGIVQANLLEGSLLRTPQVEMSLPFSAWEGEVVEVDEAAREVVISLPNAADLPDGDALAGQTIYFSNPDYSRNTAYHIAGITRDGDGVRVRVREATFLLGKAVIDGPPLDAQTLSTIIPHAYSQPLGRGEVSQDADFFTGKLLTTADGATQTTVRRLRYGQPTTIVVDSVTGFADGTECYYQDARPGDTVTILTQASLQRGDGGSYLLRANAPVKIGGETIAASAAAQGVQVRLR